MGRTIYTRSQEENEYKGPMWPLYYCGTGITIAVAVLVAKLGVIVYLAS